MKKYIYILSISLILFLNACHKRIPPSSASSPSDNPQIEDIKFFPQNLEVYAKLAGSDKLLLTQAEQQILAKKYLAIYFAPWEMNKTSIRKQEIASLFNNPRGYKIDNIKWTPAEWANLRENASLLSFPSLHAKGITVKNANLRELPTHEYRFSEPTPDPKINPFDYFQYSCLPAGMPVHIAHVSRDGRWYFVECPIAGGWIDADALAFVDEAFMAKWRENNFAAVIKDKVKFGSPEADNFKLDIGTLLPLLAKKPDGDYTLLLPRKNVDNYATFSEITLPGNAVRQWPLLLTPANIAQVGNEMMGQRYGWGGMFGDRDCSALIRDIFMPFGIWLPRNSASQAKKGHVISLTGLAPAEKQNTILSKGIPFLSLLGMKGHICLYLGNYKNKAAILHNVWGIRVVENGNDDARFIIGKAVVTSVMPGMELKNLYLPRTFIDRLRTLTILN